MQISKRFWFLFSLSSLFTGAAMAQILYEGGRVMSYEEKIVNGVFMSGRQYSISLVPINEYGQRVDSLAVRFEPNSNRLIGANIVYGDVGIRFSIKVPKLD